MKWRIRQASLLVILLLTLVACAAQEDTPVETATPPIAASSISDNTDAEPDEAPVAILALQPGAGMVEVKANRDLVTLQRGGVWEDLPWPGTANLTVGDGVNVDEHGIAKFTFDPSPILELARDGKLKIDALETTLLTKVHINYGTLFGVHNPLNKDNVLNIESDFATIEVTGTEFVVVRENNTPLEWVITLDAHTDNAVTVASKNGTAKKSVPNGVARWIAPIDEPSLEVPYNKAAVTQWLQQVRDGETVHEIGRVLWPMATLTSTMKPIESLPPIGDPFVLEGVTMTLKSGTYELDDCNGDGIEDVAMKDGVLKMDFRGLLARVGYLETDVINRAATGKGTLVVFNPAYDVIDMNLLQGEPGQATTLGLDADKPLNLPSDQLIGQPYHYAELTLSDGCFIRFGTTPSQPTTRPAQPAESEVCRTAVSGLFLRKGPGQTEPATGTLGRGTAVATTGRSADGEWLAVRTSDGRTGWVSASLVTCAVGTLPPVTPQPTPVCVKSQPVGWGTYLVRSGDTLSAIAQRSCGSVGEIAEANCVAPSRVLADTVLYVPRCFTPPTAVPTVQTSTRLPDLVADVTPGNQRMDCRDSKTGRTAAIVLPVNAVVTNRGSAVAGPFQVLVEVYSGQGEAIRTYVDSGRLSPGKSVSLPIDLRLPLDMQGASIRLRAMADSCEGLKGRRAASCQVVESNEANNWSPTYPVTVIGNTAPAISISAPASSQCSFYDDGVGLYYALVTLKASVYDCEEGTLPDANIIWATDVGTTGGRQQVIGQGPQVTAQLYCGTSEGRGVSGDTVHTIILSATDSSGAVTTDSAVITVAVSTEITPTFTPTFTPTISLN